MTKTRSTEVELELKIRNAREQFLKTFTMEDFGRVQTAEEALVRFHEAKAEEEVGV